MQVFSVNTILPSSKSFTYFGYSCSHHQADPKNIKKGNYTVHIFVGDIGPYECVIQV